MSGLKRRISSLNAGKDHPLRSLNQRLQEVEEEYLAARASLRQRSICETNSFDSPEIQPEVAERLVLPAPQTDPVIPQSPRRSPARFNQRARQQPSPRSGHFDYRQAEADAPVEDGPQAAAWQPQSDENEIQRLALLLEAQALQQEIRNSCQVPAVDLQGNVLEYFFEVDAWSDGKLEQLETYLQRCQEWLQAGFLDEIQLAAICCNLEEVQTWLPVVVQEARQAVLSSQLRYELAAQITERLQLQGYQLTAGSYIDQDLRQPYLLCLTGAAGSQVWIQVEPAPDEPYFNRARLEVVSSQAAGLQAQQQSELSAALRCSGLALVTPENSTLAAAGPEEYTASYPREVQYVPG